MKLRWSFRPLVTMALMAVASCSALALPAFAQTSTNCAPRQLIVERLEGQFSETVQMIGLGGGNRLFELYASPDTGTWSIVTTTVKGVACLVASGNSFEQVFAPPLIEGDGL